jgi:hypothetical protein
LDQPTTGSTIGQPTPQRPQGAWNDSLSQLDVYAERARVALPAAPPGLLEGYMRFAPWIAIIFGILGVLGSVALMGLGAVLSPFMLFAGAQGVSAGGALFVALIIGLISSVLDVVGGYLMLKRSANGWWILALGLVVSLLSNLLRGGIFTLIVILLVSYIHLQVRPNYR